MQSGIYAITNVENNKTYIGSTIDFSQRWGAHKSELRKGVHCNPHLQSSWNKYGEDAFEFMVCEYVGDLGQLVDREQYWLDFHRMHVDVYNIALVAGSPMRGRKHSEETKQRMSEIKMGHLVSREARCKMSKAHMGHPGCRHTEEARRRIGKAQLGHVVSKETRRKIGDANRGRKLPPISEETRSRMSKPMSEERKQKIREALKLYWARIREQSTT